MTGMSGISRISKGEEKIKDEVTDHKYHTHSNGQTHWQLREPSPNSHTAFILTPLAKPNNIESMQICNIDKASNKLHNSY